MFINKCEKYIEMREENIFFWCACLHLQSRFQSKYLHELWNCPWTPVDVQWHILDLNSTWNILDFVLVISINSGIKGQRCWVVKLGVGSLEAAITSDHKVSPRCSLSRKHVTVYAGTIVKGFFLFAHRDPLRMLRIFYSADAGNFRNLWENCHHQFLP